MTIAISMPPKQAKFGVDFSTGSNSPHYKHFLHFVLLSLSGPYAHLQSRRDRLLYGFGVALVTLNLYKLAQPAKG